MFTQRISMDCTKEQYEKYLKDELLKMGYREICMGSWDGCGGITNNIDGNNGGVSNIFECDYKNHNRTYLGSFNAPLFLALAAMTDKPEGNYREYVIGLISGNFYRMGYNEWIQPEHTLIRKATKEEIIARFSKTEPDTNYDAAKEFVKDFYDKANNLKVAAICDNIHQSANKAKELENAIKLLRENGYKILKPKTWEEI